MAIASHGILDLFTPGPGIELLWPLTEAAFEAPWRPLPNPPVGPDLLSVRGLMTLAFEATIFAPLVAWSLWRGSRRR